MELKKSDKLQGLIKAYHDEKARIAQQRGDSDRLAEELAAKLAKAKSELEQAMDATLEQATEANLRRERDLRRKVAELELDLKGVEARKTRAFTSGSGKAQEIAREAVELARQEAQAAHDKHVEAAKQRVEDAKYAYLLSLVEYKRFTDDVNAIFFETRAETNQTNSEVQRPFTLELRPHLQIPYYENRYGVLETEVREAYQYGRIGRYSVAEDRIIK